MQEHEVNKVYIARVQGCFSEGVQRVNAPLCWDSKLNFASVTEVGLHPLAAQILSPGGIVGPRPGVVAEPNQLIWIGLNCLYRARCSFQKFHTSSTGMLSSGLNFAEMFAQKRQTARRVLQPCRWPKAFFACCKEPLPVPIEGGRMQSTLQGEEELLWPCPASSPTWDILVC